MEEHEVADLELVARHPPALVVLEAGVVTELHPELGVDVHREPGAVEAGRRRAAPDVGDAEEVKRERHRLAAERIRRDVGNDERGNARHRRLRRGKLRQSEHDRGPAGRNSRVSGARQSDEELRPGRESERRVGDECSERDEP